MRCAKCGSETPIGHRCIMDDLEAIRNVDLSDHPLFKREAEAAPEPREDVAVAAVLAANWRTFGAHAPVGAYLPIGQLDGDCGTCGGSWPCGPYLTALAPLIAERERSAVAEVGLTEAEWTRLRHAAGNRGDLGPIAEEVERILGERVAKAWDEGYDTGADQTYADERGYDPGPRVNPYRADRRAER